MYVQNRRKRLNFSKKDKEKAFLLFILCGKAQMEEMPVSFLTKKEYSD